MKLFAVLGMVFVIVTVVIGAFALMANERRKALEDSRNRIRATYGNDVIID